MSTMSDIAATSPGPIQVREALKTLALDLGRVRLGLVVAPGGSGKTTLLRCWRDSAGAGGTQSAWLDLTVLHDDVVILIEDLVDSLRSATSAPEFGSELLRELTHVNSHDAPVLARRVTRALREINRPVLVFVDNFHLLEPNGASSHVLDLLLRDERVPLRFAIASRGARPACTAKLLTDGQAFEVTSSDLSLRSDQIAKILAARGIEPGMVLALLLAETRGWATGVQLATHAMERVAEEDRVAFIRSLGNHANLFDYVANEIIADETSEMLEMLERSALTGPMTETNLDVIASGMSGAKRVEEALGKGLLIRFGEQLGVHHLWGDLLRRRLRQRLAPDDWRALHRRLGERLRTDDPERALLLWSEAGFWDGVVEILDERGHDWIDAGRFRFVADWLEKLPEDRVEKSPRLAYLAALARHRHDAAAAIARLEEIAPRLSRIGDHRGASAALMDAWIFAQNENIPEAMTRLLPRLLSLRRLATDPDARALGKRAVAILAASRNRHALAQRILRRLRNAGGSSLSRTTVIMGLMIIGRYRDATQTREMLDEVIDDPAYREHAPSHFMFVAVRALLRGLQGIDRERCVLDATEAAEAFQDFGLTISEMASRDALGKLLTFEGRREEALEAFERAATLAGRIGHQFYEASMRGHAALELLVLGRQPQAEAVARRAALQLSEVNPKQRDPISIRFPAMVVWRALAECGHAEEALAAARSRARAYRSPDLPAGTYQTALQMARIAELAGDEAERTRSLARTRDVLERVGDDAIGPDLDPEILAWAETLGHGAHARAESRWDIRTLGRIEVVRGGKLIPERAWRGATIRRLLVRMLAARGEERREVIQLDLWPDSDSKRAAANLRVALSGLRSVLGSEAVQSEGDRIALAPELLAHWDVARLEGCDAVTAAGLYRGAFAPELYDDWAEDLRREIEARFLSKTTSEAERLLETDANAALAVVTRLTEVAPFEEDAWILRARAERACGDLATARRTLARARVELARELGREPGPALLALERELGAA